MRDVTSRGSLVARTANLTHPTVAKGRTAPGQFALLANRYMERWGIDARDARPGRGQEPRARDPEPEGALPHADHGRGGDGGADRGRAVRHARLHADDRRRRRASCSPRSPGRARTPSTTSSSAASGSPSRSGYYTTFFDEDERLPRLPRHARGRGRRLRARRGSRTRARSSTSSSATTASPSPSSSTPRISASAAAARVARCSRAAPRALGGDIPVNVSGGLQSCGHPVGATGVRMIAEIGDHVLGRAGERQVEGAQARRRAHARRPRRRLDRLRRRRRRLSRSTG